MKKGLQWKIIATVAILGLAIFLAYPPKTKLKPGLDLQGGIHLLLQVLTEDAVNMETDQEIVRFEELFKKNDIVYQSAAKERPGRFTIQGLSIGQEGKIKKITDQYARDWDFTFTADRLTFTLKQPVALFLKDQAVSQALETIRNRIDQFGVSEPLIQRQGKERIIVELPGVSDPERVKDLIKVTAVLEWKLVHGAAADEESLLKAYGGKVPEGMEVVPGNLNNAHLQPFYLLSKVATVTGKDLRTVRQSQDSWNNPAVSFTMDGDGGARFEKATGENVGKQIAIVLDGKVQSSPTVEVQIHRNEGGIIQGNFSVKEVEDLVIVLKAGALPAGIRYLEERTIGPSLGADSVRQGLLAGLVAIMLVMAFMIFYYKLSGINAVLALILNVILLFGTMAYFKATFTLPGIAGIILSLGMAVDANVLIFERIKEERAAGKSVSNAIQQGFNRAFSAIFDSNLTTIISAVFLFQFGTGTIKGYAVTLIISLVANMFTAVFVSHLLFDVTIPKTAKKLSI